MVADRFENRAMAQLKAKKQGRIHEPKSRGVGRGSDDKVLPKPLGRSSNAKTARNAEKANDDRHTDRPMDRAGCRVACTRLKMYSGYKCLLRVS